ncbi:Ig-like domain-containing protein [Aquipseudomonas alcaligenes]|uniref:Ig-like domain-containing protein n=1 Tax=Aquipseudomonas alcaligenes TaxID=43263 RepID=UPI001F43C84D|nr:Ig-like domain-containing protein [Pseudomonas alcaligenes]BDC78533.1 hypothetical protein MRCP2_p2680 [Pseudomonas alcaligenes]
MTFAKAVTFISLIFAASISNSVLAAECALTNADLRINPANAYQGDSLKVSYSADRASCSGVGSFEYKVLVGSKTGEVLGRCEGVRTVDDESCVGDVALPEGFVGEINLWVNGSVQTVKVAGRPQLPVITAKTMSTLEDTPVEIDLASGGEAYAKYELEKVPFFTEGSATIIGSKLTFTPAKDWFGQSTFSYLAYDDNGRVSQPMPVTVDVAPAPDAPVLIQTSLLGVEDQDIKFTPRVIDADVDDTYTLFVVDQGDPAFGSVAIDGTAVVFTPAPNWAGETSFSIKAVDSFGLESFAQSYSVHVEDANDPPVVAAQSLSLVEDEFAESTVTYTDIDGPAPYSVIVSSQPAVSAGSCSVVGEVVRFTPAPNWSGVASCVVSVGDGSGAVGSETFKYTVVPLNDAPTAQSAQVTLNQGVAGYADITMSDPDAGDSLTIVLMDAAVSDFGVVSVSGARITIAPAAGFYGTRRIAFKVVDGSGAQSEVSYVFVKVLPVNGAPVLAAKEFAVAKGTAFTTKIAAIDPNRDSPLVYSVVTQAAPAQGAISISGDTLTFTPAAGFIGTAQGTIKATDPSGLASAPATFKFIVSDAIIVATDPDIPDSHQVVIVQQPDASVGELTVVGSKVTLTPVKGFYGTGSFQYKVIDSFGAESAVATGTITVDKYNYAPTSTSASITVQEGATSLPITPAVADENPYDEGKHSFVVPIQATSGFVEVVNNQIVYTAAYGFSGVEKFKYLAIDQGGLSVVGEVTVMVTPLNYAPTYVGGNATAGEGLPVVVPLSVQDKNPTDTFTYSILQQQPGGAATISGNKVTFTPGAGFIGTVRIPVQAQDQGGLTVDGFAVATVEKSNAAPTSLTGSIKVFENGVSAPYYPKIADANAYDFGKHALVIVEAPASGSAQIVDNKIVYTPNPGYTGNDLFKVSATDLAGASVTGSVSVVVEQLNSAPVASALRIFTYEGEPSEPVLPWVEDPNGWDAFTYEVVSQPSHGSVALADEGFVYTPEAGFYGTDEFTYRVVDLGGEFLESVARVNVAKKNYAPTGFTPVDGAFYAGVGRTFKLAAIDPNAWGSHTFSVVTQPEHGEIWFDGNNLVYRTTGDTPTQAVIRVTDQEGLYYEGPFQLSPKPVSDLIDGLPVVDLPSGQISTPAITQSFNRPNGMPGFVLTDAAALAELGTEWVVILDAQSEVPLKLSGKSLQPSQGVRFTVDYLSKTAIGTSLAAVEEGKRGQAFVKIARMDATGSVYRIPVTVWSPDAKISFSSNPALQLIDRVRGQLAATTNECVFTVSEQIASKANPYEAPSCFVEFSKRPMETRLISSDSTLAFQGPIENAGTQQVTAEAYILGEGGDRHLVGRYSEDLVVNSMENGITMAVKYPFDEAYYKVQELDIDFRQATGPTCDLSVIDFRAKNAAATFSTRPVCLVEWTEIPVGLSARQNWEKPYLLGASNYLGTNAIRWDLSIYSPSGVKHPIGSGSFEYKVVEPPAIAIEYDSKSSKLADGLFSSYTSGQYIGDAIVKSASARLTLSHQFNEGKQETEQLQPAFSRDQTIQRRIYTAPFNAVWESREIKSEAFYQAIADTKVASSIRVISIPDQGIMPIIDNENQKLLSTEDLEVTVGIGDIYNESTPYDAVMMGSWDVRLVTKPSWNTVEPLTDWVTTDAGGKSSFNVPLADLAGKSLRIYAEARPISPFPEYQVVRMSPKPLSIAILNGAALDGSVRALRLTGEAPLRVTMFADVTNKAWTRDLGNVRWEISSNGGAWEPFVNPGKTPQRLATTFQKGNYKVRAELTNKHSGAKAMTEAIEIIAYNVPKGSLKGPGNTFLDADAKFKVLKLDGSPIDMSNIDIQWSLDRGATWADGVNTMSITRSTEQRVYVYARMKYKDSPIDDPKIWKVLRGGVAFRKVRPPRVQLIGPRRPEVGVEAKWVANMLMPYPNMDLTMNGEFIMPKGGAIVPGQEATYTPTEDDLTLEMTEISYRAWIEGYRDKGGEGLTTQRITFWLYDWPEWAIQPTFSSEYAPADLTLRVRNIGEFKGVEGVYYEWELPAQPGYSITKDDNMALRILKIEEPAAYPFRVHVYDARGNYSMVERQMTFLPPPPWEVRLAWSGDNNAHRAPMGVLVRPYISGGHPKDTVTKMEYRLDGEKIDTGGSRYARATLPTEGAYQFKLNIETMMGKATEGEVVVEVKENVPPTCELEVKEGATAWTASAKCQDTDGRIARHHWFVDDKLQGLGGSVITISKRTYPAAPRIILVAVDDSGEESPAVAW